MQKTIFTFAALICIFSLFSCSEPNTNNDYNITPPDPINNSNTTEPKDPPVVLKPYQLNNNGMMPADECAARGLEKKIIVLESAFCGHCRTLVPKLEALQEEIGINMEFLDLADQSGLDRAKELYLSTRYTPTVIMDCEIVIGAKDIEYYSKLIDQHFEGDDIEE